MTQIPVRPPHKIVLGDVWQGTSAFLASESRLLVPVAFATIFMGDMLSGLGGLLFGDTGLVYGLTLFVAVVLRLLGALTITILVLGDRLSVREAFAFAWGRLPRLMAVALLLGGALLLLLSPTLPYIYQLMVAMVANDGKMPADAGTMLPVWASFYLLGWSIIFWWMLIRMLLVLPIVAAGEDGIIAAMKASYHLSADMKWRLLGAVLLYSVVNGVTVLTAQMIPTILWKLAIRSDTLDSSGVLLIYALGAAVSTMFLLAAVTFVARLYRSLVAA